MKKYLLTGVAGFIAASVAENLLKAGHTVIGLDNLNDYYDVELKKHRLVGLKSYANFEFFEIDIENKKAMEPLFVKHGFDAIINLAARAGVRYSQVNPHVYFTTNANGTLNLLELAKEHKIKKFLLASTSSVYAGLPIPFIETMDVRRPISPYSASKLAAETLCYTYHHLYGIDVSVVRYFTVYGPLGRPDMSPFRFIRWIDEGKPLQIFGTGEQKRDFTYVDDIAIGTVLALKEVGYKIINLGGSHTITLNQMIQYLENYLGKKAVKNHEPKILADMDETLADVTQAKKILEWTPKISVAEGMEKTVKHYLDNRTQYQKYKI